MEDLPPVTGHPNGPPAPTLARSFPKGVHTSEPGPGRTGRSPWSLLLRPHPSLGRGAPLCLGLTSSTPASRSPWMPCVLRPPPPRPQTPSRFDPSPGPPRRSAPTGAHQRVGLHPRRPGPPSQVLSSSPETSPRAPGPSHADGLPVLGPPEAVRPRVPSAYPAPAGGSPGAPFGGVLGCTRGSTTPAGLPRGSDRLVRAASGEGRPVPRRCATGLQGSLPPDSTPTLLPPWVRGGWAVSRWTSGRRWTRLG